jgi:hypothetical protein
VEPCRCRPTEFPAALTNAQSQSETQRNLQKKAWNRGGIDAPTGASSTGETCREPNY